MMGLNDAKKFLNACFEDCQSVLNDDLKLFMKKDALITDFNIGLNLLEKNIVVSESKDKDKRTLHFPIEVFREVESLYGTLFSEENHKYYSSIAYGSKYNEEKADIYISLLMRISIQVLIFHELGHIYNGHLLYLEDNKNNNIDPKVYRAFEWNADDFAATRIIARYAEEKVIEDLNNLSPNLILSLDHMFLLIV